MSEEESVVDSDPEIIGSRKNTIDSMENEIN